MEALVVLDATSADTRSEDSLAHISRPGHEHLSLFHEESFG